MNKTHLPCFEALEPRILLSASPLPDQDETVIAAPVEQVVASHHLAFVDTSVAQYSGFLDKIPDAEVHFIAAGEDGLAAISAVLATHQDVGGIHIASAPTLDGSLKLGSVTLTAANLSDFTATLSQWRDSFTADAQITLHGRTASLDYSFNNQLEQATGLQVTEDGRTEWRQAYLVQAEADLRQQFSDLGAAFPEQAFQFLDAHGLKPALLQTVGPDYRILKHVDTVLNELDADVADRNANKIFAMCLARRESTVAATDIPFYTVTNPAIYDGRTTADYGITSIDLAPDKTVIAALVVDMMYANNWDKAAALAHYNEIYTYLTGDLGNETLNNFDLANSAYSQYFNSVEALGSLLDDYYAAYNSKADRQPFASVAEYIAKLDSFQQITVQPFIGKDGAYIDWKNMMPAENDGNWIVYTHLADTLPLNEMQWIFERFMDENAIPEWRLRTYGSYGADAVANISNPFSDERDTHMRLEWVGGRCGGMSQIAIDTYKALGVGATQMHIPGHDFMMHYLYNQVDGTYDTRQLQAISQAFHAEQLWFISEDNSFRTQNSYSMSNFEYQLGAPLAANGDNLQDYLDSRSKVRQATATADFATREQLLLQAVESSPYNPEAWYELFDLHGGDFSALTHVATLLKQALPNNYDGLYDAIINSSHVSELADRLTLDGDSTANNQRLYRDTVLTAMVTQAYERKAPMTAEALDFIANEAKTNQYNYNYLLTPAQFESKFGSSTRYGLVGNTSFPGILAMAQKQVTDEATMATLEAEIASGSYSGNALLNRQTLLVNLQASSVNYYAFMEPLANPAEGPYAISVSFDGQLGSVLQSQARAVDQGSFTTLVTPAANALIDSITVNGVALDLSSVTDLRETYTLSLTGIAGDTDVQVNFRQLSYEDNLVRNGGFDTADKYWDASTLSTTTSDLKYATIAGTGNSLTQTINLNDYFTDRQIDDSGALWSNYGVDFKSSSPDVTAEFTLTLHDLSGNVIQSYRLGPQTLTGANWETLKGYVSIPFGTRSITLTATQLSGTGELYVDNVHSEFILGQGNNLTISYDKTLGTSSVKSTVIAPTQTNKSIVFTPAANAAIQAITVNGVAVDLSAVLDLRKPYTLNLTNITGDTTVAVTYDRLDFGDQLLRNTEFTGSTSEFWEVEGTSDFTSSSGDIALRTFFGTITSQTVNLSTYFSTADIDSGTLFANFSGQLKTYNLKSTLSLSFYDDFGHQLSENTTSSVNSNSWNARSGLAFVPPGARSAVFEVIQLGTNTSGSVQLDKAALSFEQVQPNHVSVTSTPGLGSVSNTGDILHPTQTSFSTVITPAATALIDSITINGVALDLSSVDPRLPYTLNLSGITGDILVDANFRQVTFADQLLNNSGFTGKTAANWQAAGSYDFISTNGNDVIRLYYGATLQQSTDLTQYFTPAQLDGGTMVANFGGLQQTGSSNTYALDAEIHLKFYDANGQLLRDAALPSSKNTSAWDNRAGYADVPAGARTAVYELVLTGTNVNGNARLDAAFLSFYKDSAATGAVTIAGSPTQGQVLTAANSIADIDGMGALTYTWMANGTAFATGTSVTLAEAQVGKSITVTASYVDGLGRTESLSSGPTAAVANVNDAATGAVTITGTTLLGQVLSATNSLADADGLGSITYTWKADGVAVATGSTFTLGSSVLGKAITVTASYTDGHGTVESLTSAATAPITSSVTTANVLINPTFEANTSSWTGTSTAWDSATKSLRVTNGGDAKQTVSLSSWVSTAAIDAGNVTASFGGSQWTVNSSFAAPSVISISFFNASGALISTSALPQSFNKTGVDNFSATIAIPAGARTVVYTFDHTGTGGNVRGDNFNLAFTTTAQIQSNSAPTGTLTIAGTPTQGQVLTASNTLADLDGMGTITYTWKANGTAFASGSSVTLAEAQVGKTITLTASYTDARGTAESVTSAATAAVAALITNTAPTGGVSITGSFTQGQTLNAANTLADLDGMGAITYTWKANGSVVGTGTTYILSAADVGKTLSLTASYTDGKGKAESVTSAVSPVVVASPATLEAAVATGNLLLNSSFDANTNGWATTNAIWLSNEKAIRVNAGTEATQSVNLTASISATAIDAGRITANFGGDQWTPNSGYAAPSVIKINFLDANGTLISSSALPQSLNKTGVDKFSATVDVPAGARTAVYVFDNLGGSSGNVRGDNFFLKLATKPQLATVASTSVVGSGSSASGSLSYSAVAPSFSFSFVSSSVTLTSQQQSELLAGLSIVDNGNGAATWQLNLSPSLVNLLALSRSLDLNFNLTLTNAAGASSTASQSIQLLADTDEEEIFPSYEVVGDLFRADDAAFIAMVVLKAPATLQADLDQLEMLWL